MNISFDKEFEFVVERAKSLSRPARVVVAGADAENMMKGVFIAQEEGFVEPIFVGKEEKIHKMLEELGFADRKYKLQAIDRSINPVQYAIEMINSGAADILMRGNTQTRDFLMAILNKANHLIEPGKLVTHVQMMKIPGYEKLIGISDVTLLIAPTAEERQEVAVNLVKAMNLVGVARPNIALLAMIETPAFHMRDTVEDQTMVKEHSKRPIADCNLVGPISYDLIMNKESARLKNYDCPYCGEFDGIVVPNLMSGNLMVKVLEQSAGATGFGILMGTKVPVSISGRSEGPVGTFLSLAGCAAMLRDKEEGK